MKDKIKKERSNILFITAYLHTILARSQLTSGGFTSVAAFGTEYSRLDKTKLWKKEVHFTREVVIA
ncbi:MAG: hypothetical protein CFE23_16555 [Flavobacterium sp. BFFFF1]|nr:MAG: hypothetical protein CFE23_16555 [Flavobacterium sp. BFFFF1]